MEGSVMTQHPSLEHRVLKAWGEMGEMKNPIEDKLQKERGVSRTAFFVFASFILSTFSFPFS